MASFDEAIPPGGKGEILVRVDTSRLHGAQSRWVVLQTNDPTRPIVKLEIRLQVVGSVELLPEAALRLGRRRGRAQEARLLVRRAPDEQGELRVEEIRASEPWLIVQARPATAGERVGRFQAGPGDWIVEARAGEGAPYGPSRASVRFRTGLSREPEVEVPVFAYIRPPVEVRPRVLKLAPPKPGAPPEGEVLVVVSPGQTVTAPQFETTPPGFRVDVDQTGPRHFRVRIRWNKPGEPRAGTLRIRVGDESVEVPLQMTEAARLE